MIEAMKREILQKIRNQMIKDVWETHKAEWEMSDLAFIFNKSIPQIYRIIAVLSGKVAVPAESGRNKTAKLT